MEEERENGVEEEDEMKERWGKGIYITRVKWRIPGRV